MSGERKSRKQRCRLTLSSPTGISGWLRTPRELALFMLHPREPHASTLGQRAGVRSHGGMGMCGLKHVKAITQ